MVFSAGPHVRALEVSADGAARLAFERAEPEDISALHACTFPAGFPVSACVVAGLWNRNSVVFHPLEAGEREVEIAELGEELVGGQPRAIAVASTSGAAGGHVTLVVGSITGAFTAFAVDRDLNVARTLRVSVGAAPVCVIPVLAEGRAALEKLNAERGFGFDDADLDYYTNLFVGKLGRDPTDVECFDMAQSNSEHSRHWCAH